METKPDIDQVCDNWVPYPGVIIRKNDQKVPFLNFTFSTADPDLQQAGNQQQFPVPGMVCCTEETGTRLQYREG